MSTSEWGFKMKEFAAKMVIAILLTSLLLMLIPVPAHAAYTYFNDFETVIDFDYGSMSPTREAAAAGTWHAIVHKDSVASPLETGYIADDPNSVVEDSFEVTAQAIPEFPTVIAGIVVARLCGGIILTDEWRKARERQ